MGLHLKNLVIGETFENNCIKSQIWISAWQQIGLVVMGRDSRSEGRGFEIPAPYTGRTFFHTDLL